VAAPITWMRAIFALAGIGVAAMLLAWSGAIQISASSGLWRVTAWFLHWVMRNSVRTYSHLQAPDDALDESGLINAAGYFRQDRQVFTARRASVLYSSCRKPRRQPPTLRNSERMADPWAVLDYPPWCEVHRHA